MGLVSPSDNVLMQWLSVLDTGQHIMPCDQGNLVVCRISNSDVQKMIVTLCRWA